MNKWLLVAVTALSCSSCMRFVYTSGPGLVTGAPTRVRTMREGRALAAAYRAQLEVDGVTARQRYKESMREPGVPSLSAPPKLREGRSACAESSSPR